MLLIVNKPSNLTWREKTKNGIQSRILQNSSGPLYSETKKSENTLDAKIKKWFRAFKGYKSSYNVNMLNCLILKYNLKMLNL